MLTVSNGRKQPASSLSRGPRRDQKASPSPSRHTGMGAKHVKNAVHALQAAFVAFLLDVLPSAVGRAGECGHFGGGPMHGYRQVGRLPAAR